MAFIEKIDPTVLNIKLTTKGREMLSAGNLKFSYYAVGDSEMDYQFVAAVKAVNPAYTPFNSNILRPADNNPMIISFIPRNLSGDPYNTIPTISPFAYAVVNQTDPIGFFTNSGTTFITDSNHVKQPDAMVDMSTVAGGMSLALKKAPLYGRSGEEPAVGDLILVKWTLNDSTTGDTINKYKPTPYLIYQISAITSGTLAANNLIVTVDRPLPNFTGHATTAKAGAMIYYNFINYTGSTIFNDTPTDYLDNSVISFLENSQCPTVIFPFWNMSIIFTEEIAGVQLADRKFGQFNSAAYGGFVSYIQSQAKDIVGYKKKLGVIHYTNSSPANVYAEGFYLKTMILDVPTIMWHKSTGTTLGAKFRAGNGYTLIDLGIHYYDLVDVTNPSVIVGKIFDELKMFLIEDQELLNAMSYKSNRNWTIPDFTLAGSTGNCFAAPEAPPTLFVQTIIGQPGSIKNTGGFNIAGYQNITEYGMEFRATGSTLWTRVKGGTTLTSNSFNMDITGTTPNTSYNYHAYVKIGNNEYIDHSNDDVVIKTPAAPPVVIPPPVYVPHVETITGTAGIGRIDATGGESISGNTGLVVEKYGMEYKRLLDSEWILSPTTPYLGPILGTSFAHNITGLVNTTPTTYDYRAYIQVAGVKYVSSSYKTINVQAQPAQTHYAPQVSTGIIFKQITNSTTQSIDVLIKNSSVSDKGGLPITRYGVLYTDWQTFSSPAALTYGNVGAEVRMVYVDADPTIAFASNLTGLADSSPFWYRAFAINSVGIGYGEIVNGTTIPLAIVAPPKSIYICGVTETGTNPSVTSTITAKIGVSSPLAAGESVILHITNSALSDTITPPNQMLIGNIRACAYYTIGAGTSANILANTIIPIATQDTCSCSNSGTITITSSNIDSICLHANAYSASKNLSYSYTNKAVVTITSIENVGGANYTLGSNYYCADNSGSGSGGGWSNIV